MTAKDSKKIWKIRTIKNYPEAHNHICVGEVLDLEDAYVRLRCRTYHFSKSVNGLKDVRVGDIGVRIFSWNRIEIINELAPGFNYEQSKLSLDDQRKIVLSDGTFSYTIASSYESRY
jgi:hypothetical protein